MKSLLKYMTFALVVGLLFWGFDAAADDAFERALKTLAKVFKNVRVIVYVIGAFGLIALAVGGIMGKIDFKKLGYLAAGLAIVAAADLVVSYAVKGGQDGLGDGSNLDWENQLKQN